MRCHHASHTAEYMALFRAIESARPPARRLFYDPFARTFLRPSLRIVADMARLPWFGNVIPWLIDTWWPGARSSGVARTRFIDDILIRALHDGVQQVVILGAGFDCRAYRIAGLEQVQVIEVDHPDTLRVKRQHVQQMLRTSPQHVCFVAVDFNTQRLEDVVTPAICDATRPTFFLWEGVTNYLTAEAVDTTFRALHRLATQSAVLFTYVHRAVLEAGTTFAGTTRLHRTLQRVGERWTFGFDPTALPEYLAQRGFRLIGDGGSVDYRARYLGASRRHQRGYEFYRVALAERQPH
jgi:methyltransferase (TIGR00027 family)